ncbi:hypothetical protein [Pseudoflavitalea rhizosphaerae]|uniref:hypothetical protein n=1 Tax=Pseudoflavitalea rhizosphaerae TaxID=1884793 RepID=UPI0013DE872E|nr:hypothetical protein [Pseudoflavitalea rhizosphaerae]
MKSLLLLLLVFANMGFTIAGKDFQQPGLSMPSLTNSPSIQDCIIVASPDANRIIMN